MRRILSTLIVIALTSTFTLSCEKTKKAPEPNFSSPTEADEVSSEGAGDVTTSAPVPEKKDATTSSDVAKVPGGDVK